MAWCGMWAASRACHLGTGLAFRCAAAPWQQHLIHTILLQPPLPSCCCCCISSRDANVPAEMGRHSLQYDEPVGKNDGSIKGRQYFECGAAYGGFVRPALVRTGDYPPFDEDFNFDSGDEL